MNEVALRWNGQKQARGRELSVLESASPKVHFPLVNAVPDTASSLLCL